MAALAASLSPLRHLEDLPSAEEFFQKHYKRLTPEEMERILERITREVERQYGVRPHVREHTSSHDDPTDRPGLDDPLELFVDGHAALELGLLHR
jgi:hypothetical protein